MPFAIEMAVPIQFLAQIKSVSLPIHTRYGCIYPSALEMCASEAMPVPVCTDTFFAKNAALIRSNAYSEEASGTETGMYCTFTGSAERNQPKIITIMLFVFARAVGRSLVARRLHPSWPS